MLYYLVLYRKKNGELFERVITTLIYEKGDITHNGWFVEDIQVFYKGRFYSLDEFDNMFKHDYEEYMILYKKRKKNKQLVSKPIKFIGKKFVDLGNFIDKL